VIAIFVCLVLAAGQVAAADPPRPGPGDRCPVCGMFVARHPDWVAAIAFDDGAPVFFDGPKDMFRFLHDPVRYGAREELAEEIGEGEVSIWVTDYYSTRMIDATTALYVRGSDVVGPMGAELVPVSSEADASSFVADHGGERVLAFADVTPDDVPK